MSGGEDPGIFFMIIYSFFKLIAFIYYVSGFVSAAIEKRNKLRPLSFAGISPNKGFSPTSVTAINSFPM